MFQVNIFYYSRKYYWEAKLFLQLKVDISSFVIDSWHEYESRGYSMNEGPCDIFDKFLDLENAI